MPIRINIVLTALLAMLLPALSPAAEDDVAGEEALKRCINSRAIRRTQVLNDNVILFRTVGRKIYLNVLASSCRGLSQEGRFSFATHTRGLCAKDRINVLRDGPGGFIEGRQCKLGRFQLVTEEQLKELLSPPRVEPVPADPPAVEDVTENAAEDVSPD